MALATEVAEFLANFLVLGVTKVMKLKTTLYLTCALIFVGTGILLIYSEINGSVIEDNNMFYPVLLLFINLGIVAEFDVVYLINAEYFPPAILGTAYGICNVVARLISILAPFVAKLEHPWP